MTGLWGMCPHQEMNLEVGGKEAFTLPRAIDKAEADLLALGNFRKMVVGEFRGGYPPSGFRPSPE